MTDAGTPSDNATLSDVLHDYESEGFSGQFEITDTPTIRCVTCGMESDPAAVARYGRRRLEGASDPDDMLSVIAVACPSCGTKGVLVLGFGPNASDVDSAVSQQLRTGQRDQEEAK